MDDLQTGDLILFGPNRYDIYSRFITWWNVCELTHCGIIINNPDFGNPLRGYYVLDCQNIDDHFVFRLQKLADIVKQYENVFIRKLNCERGMYFWEKFDSIVAFLLKQREHKIEGVAKYILVTFELRKNNSIIWPCAGFVTFIYICLGLLPFDFDWTCVTVDNLSVRQSGRILPWINEDVLGKEKRYMA